MDLPKSLDAPKPGRKLLKIMDACDLAQVSRRTIYNWMAAGKIEYCRVASGNVRIYADSLFKKVPES